MNILTALFGQKKSSGSLGAKPSSHQLYLAGIREAVDSCTLTPDLVAFVNHYSGFIRHAAIARCVELGWPGLLPVVAGRLNDWVPQVRDAARSTVMTMMPLVSSIQLLATVPCVMQLLDAGRTDHAQWVVQFEHEVIRLVDVRDLLAATRGFNAKVARACFALLNKYRLVDAETLVSSVLPLRDDILLANHALALCAELSPESQRVQYGLALTSHFGAVRTTALRRLLALESDACRRQLAVAALFDVQSSVRALAMTCLRSMQFDLRAYYRHALQEPALSAKRAQVGLMSLASLRDASDIVLVRHFTKAPQSAVRVAALSAWLKLAINDKDMVATQALMDDALRVRKFALQLVRKQGAYIPFQVVFANLISRADAALLLQFSDSNKWDWLECIARVALLGMPDDELRSRLRDAINAWRRSAGRRYEVPRAEQMTFLASGEALAALGDLIGEDAQLIRNLRQARFQDC